MQVQLNPTSRGGIMFIVEFVCAWKLLFISTDIQLVISLISLIHLFIHLSLIGYYFFGFTNST